MAERWLLDAAALLNDFSFSFGGKSVYYTTPQVLGEFKDFRSKHLAENALKQGRLLLAEPLEPFAKQVISLSATHRIRGLSAADQSILAVALQWKEEGVLFSLVSDDSAMHEFCRNEGIPTRSVMRKPKKLK